MRKERVLVCLAVGTLLICAGCKDPSQAELKKGANIDISRMDGTVVAMSVRYFNGTSARTKELQGQPYYCMTIERRQAGQNSREEGFKGVPVNVFDAVSVGAKLPAAPLLTMQELAKMEGTIIDKQADASRNRFFVVIEEPKGIKAYRVDIELYYKKLDAGMKLPIQWKQ